MNTVKPLILKPFSRVAACIPRALASAALLVLVGGCVSRGSGVADVPAGENAPDSFIAQGKLSLRPLGTSKIKGFTASYRWEQVGESYDLELWGALGQGRTHIKGTAERIEIVDGTGRTVKSRNPERLLKRHLGWSLPLSVLPYWLQGKPAPSPPAPAASRMRFLASGDLEVLNQLGWSLEFGRYRDVTGQARQGRLPGRVRATSDDLKLTVVARDWRL